MRLKNTNRRIGIGAVRIPDRAPPTPPDMRVRTGRLVEVVHRQPPPRPPGFTISSALGFAPPSGLPPPSGLAARIRYRREEGPRSARTRCSATPYRSAARRPCRRIRASEHQCSVAWSGHRETRGTSHRGANQRYRVNIYVYITTQSMLRCRSTTQLLRDTLLPKLLSGELPVAEAMAETPSPTGLPGK